MSESRLLSEAAVSAREAEVLALVGERLTNAQIAGRLFISVRTVESHVSSLLRKLDVTDRHALAELATSLDGTTGVAGETVAPIRYARSDDLNIAYQVTGGGDGDLVLVAGFVSHLMLDWTERRHAHFLHRLGTFSRLIRFDKRGTGMSDRPHGLPDIETRMGDVAAVMDAARSEQAVLFGYSEGGPMSILYAASHPERVRGLVIYSSYARRMRAPDYPWGFLPEERARYAAQLEQDWAFEADMRTMCPNADDELARWWGERCRAAASPGAARALIEMASLIDVRDALGAVQAPTLVLHRRDDIDADVEEGRYLAERIPGAQFIELDGADHFIAVDPDQILDPVEDFVRGLGSSDPTESSLTTLLAVQLAESLDPAWVRGIVRDVLEEYKGVPAIADGAMVLATFDGPGRAVRCGRAIADHAARANLHLSVGVHTAEIARRGAHVSGAGVDVAQAVADRAATGEVWLTSTVRDLTADSDLSFEPRVQLDTSSDRRLELVAVRDSGH
ncbi:alpha/beta fold hydrolase [Nocardioides sp.]|uniref:alpha/beta fold hydrolase n=1 Tax=Nocardioides sp. TaxID=35761 RepID=UPI002ED05E8D